MVTDGKDGPIGERHVVEALVDVGELESLLDRAPVDVIQVYEAERLRGRCLKESSATWWHAGYRLNDASSAGTHICVAADLGVFAGNHQVGVCSGGSMSCSDSIDRESATANCVNDVCGVTIGPCPNKER